MITKKDKETGKWRHVTLEELNDPDFTIFSTFKGDLKKQPKYDIAK